MKHLLNTLSVASALLLCTASVLAQSPQWRGPDGQGHAIAKDLPVEIGPDKNMSWRTELPGTGHSTPVVDGDQIWLTMALTTPISEAEKQAKLASNTGNQPLDLAGHLFMHAVCIDRESGKLLHNIKLMEHDDPQWTHSLNSFASSSPVLENGRLYCHFGSHGTACLDTKSGKVLWKNQTVEPVMHENGPASTPVLWGDVLIFHMDGSDKQYVVGLDKNNGQQVWKTPRSGEMNANPQLKKAYGTPLVTSIHGRDVVLSPGADWLYGYDPATGEELWKVSYGALGFSIVPRPIVSDEMAYICTSFMKSQMIAVQFAENGQPIEPKVAWRYTKQMPAKPSPLLVDGLIYAIGDRGIATCLDAKTGAEVWIERLGGKYASSPMYADGKIYLGSEEGEVTVFQPGREFKLIAKSELGEPIMASPVAVGNQLIIRTEAALYSFQK